MSSSVLQYLRFKAEDPFPILTQVNQLVATIMEYIKQRVFKNKKKIILHNIENSVISLKEICAIFIFRINYKI